jgi:hypothetical protein
MLAQDSQQENIETDYDRNLQLQTIPNVEFQSMSRKWGTLQRKHSPWTHHT